MHTVLSGHPWHSHPHFLVLFTHQSFLDLYHKTIPHSGLPHPLITKNNRITTTQYIIQCSNGSTNYRQEDHSLNWKSRNSITRQWKNLLAEHISLKDMSASIDNNTTDFNETQSCIINKQFQHSYKFLFIYFFLVLSLYSPPCVLMFNCDNWKQVWGKAVTVEIIIILWLLVI